MRTVQVRKQGGAAIMTIPAQMLSQLHVDIGGVLELEVTNGALIAKPVLTKTRRRYSLQELLVNVTPDAIRDLNEETHWVFEHDTVGQEL